MGNSDNGGRDEYRNMTAAQRAIADEVIADVRAAAGAPVTEHCAGCGDEHPIGAMIAWDEGMFCLGCVQTMLYAEMRPSQDELDEELRGVRSAAASARRREALERSGWGLVRGSSETLD